MSPISVRMQDIVLSFINFVIGRLRKDTFNGKLYLLKGATLGAFAKLRKVTIGFVMSVCLHTTRFPMDRFSLNFTLVNFSKFCWEFSSLFKRTWHAVYLRLQTHALRICNIYYFSTANVVAQKRPNVVFTCTFPVLLIYEKIVLVYVWCYYAIWNFSAWLT